MMVGTIDDTVAGGLPVKVVRSGRVGWAVRLWCNSATEAFKVQTALSAF